MRLKCLSLAASAAALAAAGQAHAGDKVLLGPPPQWVVAHPPAAEPSKPGDLPVEIVQLEHQVRFEGDAQQTYSVISLKFLKPEGLQAGNITFSWEPETEDLTVNRVLIHRGDKTIDVLGEGQTFTILRREQDLEQATLTGTLTASLMPEGLQVGDVLEAVSTKVSRNPVTGSHAEDVLGPLNLAAGRVDVSVEWPQGKAMRLAETDDLPRWSRTLVDGFERASISLENVQPVIPPNDAPPRYGVARMAEATDFASWGDVANLFVPLYRKASKIPSTGPLRVELEKIRASSADPVKRAGAALQLVESRIRYVALEMGTGGLVPADAADTWARRFGDCKAKTALLLGLLHELGVEAEPVVVNAGFGDVVADRLPAVGMFNHILVRAKIAGKTYWLDGTRTGDTGLARLPVPNFGWGLPISKDAAALVRILPPPLEQPDSDMTIELDGTRGIRAPVPAKLELTLRGDNALGTNQMLASLAGNARDEALRKFWRSRFDFIDPQTYDLAFDQDQVELHLTMQGTATLDWKDGWYETDETGVGYRPDFSRAAGAGHDAPFAVSYPFFVRTRETILLPPTFTGKVSGDTTEVDETIAGVEYHRHASLTGNRFMIERTSRSLVPEIAYKDATAAAKRLRELSQNSVYLRIPNSYRMTEGDLAVVAKETPDDDPDALVTLGNSFLNLGKNADALERFQRATDLDAKNALAWADRGIAEAYLGKLSEATASLDKAAAIDPQNLYMLHGRGIVAEQRRAYTVAIDAYGQAIAVNPKDDFAYARRAQANYGAGKVDAAMADAQKAIDLKPDNLQMYALRTFALTTRKKPDDAVAEIQRMVAANAGNVDAATLAKQMLTQLGMADKARAIAGPPVDSAPTPQSFYAKALLREAKDVDGQLSDLNEALKLGPDFQPALYTRASLLYGKGQSEAALADAERALAGDPKNVDLYLLKANLLRNLGRREESLAVAKTVTEANPQMPLAHVIAGKIYQAYDRHDDAVAAIDRAIALAPEPYMYLNRADIRPFDAIEARLADVDTALKMDPEFAPALAMKADLLARKGDHAAAAKVYDTVIAKEPEETGYLVSRGIELWRAGQRAAAEKDFAAAGDRAVGAMQLNSLCYRKAAAGVDLEQALKECDESLSLSPDAPPTLDSRATVYLQMGRYADAKTDYDRALAKMPTMAPSLLGRAVARFHLGDVDGARQDLAAARKQQNDIVERYRTLGMAVPQELAS
uniref:tetratricopeptide repeat protein n=1 Tax=Altererythrobacter segetis TaxID=1104773 RepID=UPI001FAFD31D|nr:tetratricopeptide repeat protein [Altererythrobacter segetis]